jgi:flagellar motor switch/type III secretory pathway protein FliN
VILIPESVIIKFIGIFLPPSIPDGLPDMSLLEGIASTFLLEVISQIHDCCDVLRLDSVFVIDDLSFFRVLEGALSFDIKIMVGNKSAIITLLVSKESLLKLEKTKDIKQISLRNSSVLDLKVEAIIVLGISSVSSSVLNSIEEGDLLFPDSVFYPEMVKILICKGAAGILVASCKVEDQKVVVEDVIFDRLEYVMKKNLEVFDNEKTEIKGTEGEIPGRVGEIPVEVIVEAGRIEMTVGEIASLTKGSIIKLNRALSADVVLTCGGKIVAYGVLVSVEGEMGIQIVKVCQ